MNSEVVQKAKEHILHIFHSQELANHVYHDVTHTQNVVEAVEVIAKAEGLGANDIEILQLAAWFHDSGYIKKIEGHEELSAEYAREFLSKYNYPIQRIDKVANCILSTKVPQQPKNLLEMIICDADLSHLGKQNFKDRNNLFREEFEFHYGKPLTEYEWLKKSIDFLNEHHFFTNYAKKVLEPQKQENLSKLRKKFLTLTGSR
mgnify:CR=1 FL=1